MTSSGLPVAVSAVKRVAMTLMSYVHVLWTSCTVILGTYMYVDWILRDCVS